jgi:hypothetical protein
MQTKISYRALKWTFFMAGAASLASACVITTGDGDPDDVIIDGGEGNVAGTGNTAGRGGTGGSSAGSTSAGTSGSGGSSGGAASEGGSAGEGGAPTDPNYPGTCESELAVPSSPGSCQSNDNDNECGACLKTQCCAEFGACYGTAPTSACGYGTSPATPESDQGQFDCIRGCYERDNDGVKGFEDILVDCASECLNQCESEGLINTDTQDLMDCAVGSCEVECFPPAE